MRPQQPFLLPHRVRRDPQGFIVVLGVPGPASLERERRTLARLVELTDGRPEVVLGSMHPQQGWSREVGSFWGTHIRLFNIAAVSFIDTELNPVFRMAISAIALSAGHRVFFHRSRASARMELGRVQPTAA